MTNETEIIRKRYDRLAPYFDRIESMMEKMMVGELREKIWQKVQGEKVLEVGVGTGKNFPYYPAKSITAIDFSPAMINEASKKRKHSGMVVDLSIMDVQQLNFPDNHFDSVIGTFLFCSVPGPKQGLLELKRVCKPGGEVLLLEHVLSSNRIAAAIMHLLNPITVRLVGANINRETVKKVQACGFSKVDVLPESSDIVKLIRAVK
ncbi:MAG TPA: class I SAM-dependent methyltransferase [Methyloprofundus sp.]|uniref:class I SAM-dependent methyltransferase n=1 Tax=Methyloprofundus sp. TaxID=2020875 RepID=UPI0018114967|nr:class I SAM-dependent methyltransferase [Methyloprofundus sp.]HIG64161.1 class I SAM-dependent methyltransferase [Methyloprofundus sp.]HIL78791.1 class I SAM-dependent methyltransferase [Methylococcales bacterium]